MKRKKPRPKWLIPLIIAICCAVFVIIVAALIMSGFREDPEEEETGRGNVSLGIESTSLPPDTLILMAGQSQFYPDADGKTTLSVLCGSSVTEDVAVTDKDGNTVTIIKNDGSGSLTAFVTLDISAEGIYTLTPSAGGTEGNAVEYRVQPKVTEEMVETLKAVVRDAGSFVAGAGFGDSYREDALGEIANRLRKDSRVSQTTYTPTAVFFRTKDGLVGSFGLNRRRDNTLGAVSGEEALDAWADGKDTSGMTILTDTVPTGSTILHLAPYDSDSLVQFSLPYMEKLESGLASAAGLKADSAAGRSALEILGSAQETDAGVLVLSGHGGLMERNTSESSLYYFLTGELDGEDLCSIPAVADGSASFADTLWMPVREDGIRTEDIRSFFDVSLDEMTGEYLYSFGCTTNYLAQTAADRIFDNTMVLFLTCGAAGDPQLSELLLNHGASAVYGYSGELDLVCAADFLYDFCNTLGKASSDGTFASLSSFGTSHNTAGKDDYLNGFIRDEAEMQSEEGLTSKSAEEREKELRKLYLETAEVTAFACTVRSGGEKRVLAGTVSAEGCITNPDGDGASATEVSLYRWENHRFTACGTASTDEKGQYSLKDLPVGIYAIRAVNGKVEENVSANIVSSGMKLPDIQLALFYIRGTVLEKGTNKPVAGARIQISTDDDLLKLETGKDGTFETPALHEGACTIMAAAEGYLEHDLITVRLDPGKTYTVKQTVYLEKEPDHNFAASDHMAMIDDNIYSVRRIESASASSGTSRRNVMYPDFCAAEDRIPVSLAYYRGKVYFTAKTGDGFGASYNIMRCNPDGTFMETLVENVGQYGSRFAIQNEFLIWCYGFGGRSFGCINLDTEETISYFSVLGKCAAAHYALQHDEIYVAEGEKDRYTAYSIDNGKLIMRALTPQADGSVTEGIAQTAGTLKEGADNIVLVTDEAVFYTAAADGKGALYRFDNERKVSGRIDERELSGNETGGYFGS